MESRTGETEREPIPVEFIKGSLLFVSPLIGMKQHDVHQQERFYFVEIVLKSIVWLGEIILCGSFLLL